MLIVPAVDVSLAPEQYSSPLPPSAGGAHSPFVNPRLVRVMQGAYFADASRRTEPLASPLMNDDGIAALPPVLMVTAEKDSVRKQNERFADKARD